MNKRPQLIVPAVIAGVLLPLRPPEKFARAGS
jgi:hypothetical protein